MVADPGEDANKIEAFTMEANKQAQDIEEFGNPKKMQPKRSNSQGTLRIEYEENEPQIALQRENSN